MLEVVGGNHFVLTFAIEDVLTLSAGARLVFHKTVAEGMTSVFEIVEAGKMLDVGGGDHFALTVETGDRLG